MVDRVSVIIPTWNRGYCIERTIQSVLSQTHGELEVLVCDDGSTDDTADIVRRIADPRVKWLPGPRAGRPAIPRNRGIRAASGEWIAFLDSDDIWLPNKLMMQMSLLDRTKTKACSANALRLLPNGHIPGAYLSREKEILTFKELVETNWVICSSALIHHSLFDRTGFFPECPAMKALEDYAFWLRVASCTDISYCSAPLLYYLDAPAQSIRRETSTDTDMQRRLIFADFQAWADKGLRQNDTETKMRMLTATWFVLPGVRNARKKKTIRDMFGMFRRTR
ncbi:MAG TPA: glycosyltransferase [bacterium]|nr:glycosyltransferase [bacterium]